MIAVPLVELAPRSGRWRVSEGRAALSAGQAWPQDAKA
jgi:hypothetical protein